MQYLFISKVRVELKKKPRGVFNKKIVIKKMKKENNNKKVARKNLKTKTKTTKRNKTDGKNNNYNNKKGEIEIGLCWRFFFFQMTYVYHKQIETIK